jgi:hypothetical protein
MLGKHVTAMERINVGTSERGQSCNVLRESSQPICGKCGFIGESKRCEVQRKTRDLAEKHVEITMVPQDVRLVNLWKRRRSKGRVPL